MSPRHSSSSSHAVFTLPSLGPNNFKQVLFVRTDYICSDFFIPFFIRGNIFNFRLDIT